MRIIILFISIFMLCSCKVYKNVEYAHSYRDGLWYLNYCIPIIKLPKNRYFTQNKKCSKKYLYNFINSRPTIDEKITGELYDTLMNIDLINSWNNEISLWINDTTNVDPFEYKLMKREEQISKTKKEVSLYYLGELNLSDNFKSHLIMTYAFYEPIYVRSIVYLINIIDNKICSIVNVNTNFSSDLHSYTKQLAKNLFVYGDLEFESTIKKRKVLDWDSSIIFYFDEKGFIRTL